MRIKRHESIYFDNIITNRKDKGMTNTEQIKELQERVKKLEKQIETIILHLETLIHFSVNRQLYKSINIDIDTYKKKYEEFEEMKEKREGEGEGDE